VNQQTSLTELFKKMLPIFINLVFATNITTKIEGFLNLGQLLHAETVVSNSLSQLGLSSLIHSQQI
jgi:hypothetical protein